MWPSLNGSIEEKNRLISNYNTKHEPFNSYTRQDQSKMRSKLRILVHEFPFTSITWILTAFPITDNIGLHTPRTPCGLWLGSGSSDNFSLISETSTKLKTNKISNDVGNFEIHNSRKVPHKKKPHKNSHSIRISGSTAVPLELLGILSIWRLL